MNITPNELSSFGKAYDVLHIAFMVLSPALTIDYANKTAQTIFKKNKLAHQPFITVWQQMHLPALLDGQGQLIHAKPIKISKVFWQWESLPCILGKERKIVLIGKDVTAMELMYESLERSCERILGCKFSERFAPSYYLNEVYNYLNGIINQIPCYVYWKNRASQYIGCNQMAANFIHLQSTEDIIGKTDFDIFNDWELAKEYRATDEQIFATGKAVINQPGELVNSAGEVIHTLVSKIPIMNQAGEIMGLAGISVDVTDLKNAQASAEFANQVKTEFIANMSHDIRTPLTGVVGMAKLLEEQVVDANQKQYAQWLGESGKQLLHMLNGILDVVSADNVNEADVHEEEFNLLHVVQEIEQLERPSTLVKGLELVTYVDPKIPSYLISDPTKIHRILLNLLGNAIKFTQKGRVGIHINLLEKKGDRVLVQFRISDTGIGIAKELQDKVFDRFYRINPSNKGTYAGHGVGLHIAQTYVDLLGGKIFLTSELGLGTTFYFDLALKIGHSMLKIAPPRISDKLDEQVNTMLPVPSYAEDDKDAAKPKLLLVEDNKIALFTLENLISQCGCRYTSVMDGETAFHLAQKEDFDLIITDLGLPGLSGTDLAYKIRALEQEQYRSPVPIIGLTAHSEERIKQDCLQAGMNEVYTKPMTSELLLRIKNTYCAKSVEPPSLLKPHWACGQLGLDLPDTEAELFNLEPFALLNIPNALASMGGDITLLKNILRSIIEKETPADLLELKKAHEQQDWKSIEKVAHRMKSGFVYCSATKLVYACQYLERYLKAGHQKLREQLYQQLLVVVEDTKNKVKEWLSAA